MAIGHFAPSFPENPCRPRHQG